MGLLNCAFLPCGGLVQFAKVRTERNPNLRVAPKEGKPMKFRVGGYDFRIRIVDRLELFDGVEQLSGMCDVNSRHILISDTITIKNRVVVLLEQLRAAWEGLYGELDERGYAAFYADMTRQLNAKGGERALWSLQKEGWHEQGAAGDDVAAEPRGCECPICSTKYGPHQVTTGEPKFDKERQANVSHRQCECEHCGKRIDWLEGCTPSGLPNGKILAGPMMV